MEKLKQDLYGFENQSIVYDNFRPDYPEKLVNYINDYVTSKTKLIKTAADSGCMNSCALDIACGTGLFTRKLAPFFKDVFGTDISEKQLSIARQQNSGNQKYARYEEPYIVFSMFFKIIIYGATHLCPSKAHAICRQQYFN